MGYVYVLYLVGCYVVGVVVIGYLEDYLQCWCEFVFVGLQDDFVLFVGCGIGGMYSGLCWCWGCFGFCYQCCCIVVL